MSMYHNTRGKTILVGSLALLGLWLLFGFHETAGPVSRSRAVPAARSDADVRVLSDAPSLPLPDLEPIRRPAVHPPASSKHDILNLLSPVPPRVDGEPLASKTFPADSAGRTRRVDILRTSHKYPLARVEQTVEWDAATGQERVLSRVEMVADHVFVRLHPGATRQDLEEALLKYGWKVRRKMRSAGAYLVEVPGEDPDALPQALTILSGESGLIRHAEPDYVVRASETIPNDPHFNYLWALRNVGQTGGTAGADIQASSAWDITTGSRDVRVGVIDTGIDYKHPDLRTNIWVNAREIPGNGVDDDQNGFVDDVRGWDFANDDNDPMDDHGHGTHVSGTIGASGNDGVGVAGVAWDVTLVPLKILDSRGDGTTSDAADAIRHATSLGVHLTSNSWGGGGFSQDLKDAIDEADRAGILFVAAAGNDGQDADARPMYPAAYDSPNIVSVAATDPSDNLAGLSNYGARTVDLGAPGIGIVSTWTGGTFARGSGTSMAAPHVAGVCALVKTVAPEAGHLKIKDLVLRSVDPTPALAGRTVSGGRLNAYKAVLAAVGRSLMVSAVEINDRFTYHTRGNGDGVLNPGERARLFLTMRNLTTDPLSGVIARLRLRTPDPRVRIRQRLGWFGTIPALGQASGPWGFVVEVACGTFVPFAVRFVLDVTDADGRRSETDFNITVLHTVRVSGRVRLDGAPWPGTIVRYTGPLAGQRRTDAQGRYVFGAVVGSYAVRALGDDDIATPDRLIQAGKSDIDGIDFDFGTAIVQGTVMEQGSASPIDGVRVEYWGDVKGSVSSDATGRYRIRKRIPRSKTLVERLRLVRAGFLAPIDLTPRALRPGAVETADYALRRGAYDVALIVDRTDEGNVLHTVATDLNDKGQVVGNKRLGGTGSWTQPFLWENGRMRILGLGGSVDALNEASDVLIGAGIWRAGVLSQIHPELTRGYGLNDRGQVSGTTGTSFLGPTVLYDNGTLATLVNGRTSMPMINNRTQVAGVRNTTGMDFVGFVWDNGVITEFGNLGGSSPVMNNIVVLSFGDLGHAVGWSIARSNRLHPFVYRGGKLIDVMPAGGEEQGGMANDVNDRGEVVGNIHLSVNGPSSPHLYEPFLWREGVPWSLRGVMEGEQGYLNPKAINNKGQMVVEGHVNGRWGIWLWTPRMAPAGRDVRRVDGERRR